MKCARCGYFNLPGATICGKCGANPSDDFDEDAAKDDGPQLAKWDDVLPPRARQRTTATRLRQTARREVNRAVTLVSAAPRPLPHGQEMADSLRASASSVWADSRPWLVCSASFFPGVGQCFQRRFGVGLAFFAAGFFSLFFAALLARHVVSNGLLCLFLALQIGSVFDAATVAFPAVGEPSRHRLRLGFLSVGLVFGTFAVLFLTLWPWFDMVMIGGNQGAPAVRDGDGLLLRRIGADGKTLKRGDVVLATTDIFANHDGGRAPTIERILGLAGDAVDGENGELRVNGKILTPDKMPLAFGGNLTPFHVVVPPKSVCLWRAFGGNAQERDGYASYVILGTGELAGHAVAVYQPPERRRLLR